MQKQTATVTKPGKLVGVCLECGAVIPSDDWPPIVAGDVFTGKRIHPYAIHRRWHESLAPYAREVGSNDSDNP